MVIHDFRVLAFGDVRSRKFSIIHAGKLHYDRPNFVRAHATSFEVVGATPIAAIGLFRPFKKTFTRATDPNK